jgi:hypothetical protein
MSKVAALVICIVLASLAARAEEGTPCAQSHSTVGRCFVVHGRLSFWNGSPGVTIWKIGSKRILGVLDGGSLAETDQVIPPALFDRLRPSPFGTDVFADFTVCPLTRERSGWMQMVCLKGARNVVISRLDTATRK